MYGAQRFGQIVCGIALAVSSPSIDCSGGYGTQQFGFYWSEVGGEGTSGSVAPGGGGGGGKRPHLPEPWWIRKQHESEMESIILTFLEIEDGDLEVIMLDL